MEHGAVCGFLPALLHLSSMETNRTIGDLAREAGVPISTVRYYERTGLLEADSRSDANYRLYGNEAVERLRFIRSAQSAGFTLADIKALLQIRSGNTTRCAEVRVLVEQRLANVKERIEEFKSVEKVLKSFLKICRQAQDDDPCDVIDRLDT